MLWLRFCRSDPPPPPPPLSWVTGLSHWSPSDKESQTSCVFSPRCYFFSSWTVEAAPASSSCFFQSERRKCFAEGKSLCSKKKIKNQGAIPPPSLVTVWGIQSKVCPVTCSPRNKQPAESPKTKAIRGGRLVLPAKSRPPFFFSSFLFFFWKLPSWKKLLVVAVESD